MKFKRKINKKKYNIKRDLNCTKYAFAIQMERNLQIDLSQCVQAREAAILKEIT